MLMLPAMSTGNIIIVDATMLVATAEASFWRLSAKKNLLLLSPPKYEAVWEAAFASSLKVSQSFERTSPLR